jgi:hypothetical protein
VGIDPVQKQPGHERVMGVEAARQCLRQRRDLSPHALLRQVGQHGRVVLDLDQ